MTADQQLIGTWMRLTFRSLHEWRSERHIPGSGDVLALTVDLNIFDLKKAVAAYLRYEAARSEIHG